MLSTTSNTSTDQLASGPNTRTNTPSPPPLTMLFGTIPTSPDLKNPVSSLLLKKISSNNNLNVLDGIGSFAFGPHIKKSGASL